MCCSMRRVASRTRRSRIWQPSTSSWSALGEGQTRVLSSSLPSRKALEDKQGEIFGPLATAGQAPPARTSTRPMTRLCGISSTANQRHDKYGYRGSRKCKFGLDSTTTGRSPFLAPKEQRLFDCCIRCKVRQAQDKLGHLRGRFSWASRRGRS